ncbi:MAG: RHS repeat-associated core domain-containing protein [Paludibacteraceae bacterium]|nr:RHS repeat-associated core domain-containing protein [Paludibacteraceae bacterium]
MTDIDGKIIQHVAYIPYGEVFIEERDGNWNTPYLFNAKELDEETGLYYYGARYLDPKDTRWLSVDPMWESHQGMSPYIYCMGNPILFVDPTGMIEEKTKRGIWAVVGFVSGVGEAVVGVFTSEAGIGVVMFVDGADRALMNFTKIVLLIDGADENTVDAVPSNLLGTIGKSFDDDPNKRGTGQAIGEGVNDVITLVLCLGSKVPEKVATGFDQVNTVVEKINGMFKLKNFKGEEIVMEGVKSFGVNTLDAAGQATTAWGWFNEKVSSTCDNVEKKATDCWNWLKTKIE